APERRARALIALLEEDSDLRPRRSHFLQDFARAIARAVIYAQQFDLKRHGEHTLDNSAQRRTLVVNRHNDREFHAESDDSVRHLAEIGANEQYGLWADGRRARPVGRDRPTPHKN